MSRADIKSPKHCANKGINFHKLYKKLFCIFSTLFSTIILVIFVIWLILHPTKPEFFLRETNIYQLNLSSSQLLNSTIQATFHSKNPNQRIGIYYDELQVYASYKGQQITADAALPPFYLAHGEENLLTASLIGKGLPVAVSFAYEVGRDQTTGKLVLSLKMIGKLRWKVGTWVSGHYLINVKCLAIMDFTTIPSGPLISKQGSQCSTIV